MVALFRVYHDLDHKASVHLKVAKEPDFRPKMTDLDEQTQLKSVPKNVVTEYINLMQSCWDNEPSSRPTFAEAVEDLQGILEMD